MAHTVKVQDGTVVYSGPDADTGLTFNVTGGIIATGGLAVGQSATEDGFLSVDDNTNLTITTGLNGNMLIAAGDGGALYMNGAKWPETIPDRNMFLGVSATNTLEYYPFVYATALSDSLSVSELNTAYPAILPGQYVIGPTAVYLNVGTNLWRILGVNSTGTTTPLYDMTGDIFAYALKGVPVNESSANYVELTDDTTGESFGFIRISASTTLTSPITDVAGTIIGFAIPLSTGSSGAVEINHNLTINTQSGNYTFTSLDAAQTLVRMNSSSATTVTIPADMITNLPIGTNILIGRTGTGTVTIAAQGGVVVDTPETYTIYKQFGKVRAIKVAANHWELSGNLTPI